MMKLVLEFLLVVACIMIVYQFYVDVDPSRRIAILVGSDSDLPQCEEGLSCLNLMSKGSGAFVKVFGPYTCSIHRNTFSVFLLVFYLWLFRGVRVFILGAGKAAQLPGMVDAFFSFFLRMIGVTIIPVAFDCGNFLGNLAAILSILEVPGQQMELNEEGLPLEELLEGAGLSKGQAVDLGKGKVPFGAKGFLWACRHGAEAKVFRQRKLPQRKPFRCRTVAGALNAIDDLKMKGGKK